MRKKIDYSVFRCKQTELETALVNAGLDGWRLVSVIAFPSILPGLIPNRPTVNIAYELIFMRTSIALTPKIDAD